MLGRGLERCLGVIFGVLRDLEVLLGHGAVFVQVLGSIQLLSSEEFVGRRPCGKRRILPPRHRSEHGAGLGLSARCRRGARGCPPRGQKPA